MSETGDRGQGPGAASAPPRLAVVPTETVRITSDCTACGACLATCPERALRRGPKRPVVVDAACTACWACIEICPAGAIAEVTAPVPAVTDRRTARPGVPA